MVGGNMFNGLAELIVAGLIAMGIVVCVGIYATIDYFFLEDKYESSKPVVPEVVIKSETINGVIKSDTIYVYKFK